MYEKAEGDNVSILVEKWDIDGTLYIQIRWPHNIMTPLDFHRLRKTIEKDKNCRLRSPSGFIDCDLKDLKTAMAKTSQ